VLLLGFGKAHEHIHVALIGIPADEVFQNLKAAPPLKFRGDSSFP
jgi:hypothetical protein